MKDGNYWQAKYKNLVGNLDIRITVYPRNLPGSKENTLESLAKEAYLGLKSFLKDKKNGELKPVPDNIENNL